MDGDLQKRKIETTISNPPMTNIVTPTMMILLLQMIILLWTNPTMTRTVIICFYALHVPVIKGGTLNVSSGGLKSTPNDEDLFSPWDVWLMHGPSATTSTIDYLETVNHTARYRNLDIPREESRFFVYSCPDDQRRQQRDIYKMCGTGHHGDDTEGVAFTSSTETTLVLEIPPKPPPEPPPGGRECLSRKQHADVLFSTTCHHGDETEGGAVTSSTETPLVLEIPPEPPPGRRESNFRKQGADATLPIQTWQVPWDVWLMRKEGYIHFDNERYFYVKTINGQVAFNRQTGGKIDDDIVHTGPATDPTICTNHRCYDGPDLSASLEQLDLDDEEASFGGEDSESQEISVEVSKGTRSYFNHCHSRKQGADATLPTSPVKLQTAQKITEAYNIKLRRPWDVGRGETNASEEHDGYFRSWSRPGVKLPIDQNATGEESGATPSSSQQGSNKSRKEDLMYRPWDTGSQIEASCTELEEPQFHTWDVWDDAWPMMDIDEQYWGSQLARQSEWNIQATHCNEMEMILRRLRALRAHCHLRSHERLNYQWNELFYWVEYRVPRGLRTTITRSSRLFALALTPLVLLLLSLLVLMRVMVRSWLDFIPKYYIEFVYGDWNQRQRRFPLNQSPLCAILKMLLRSIGPVFVTTPCGNSWPGKRKKGSANDKGYAKKKRGRAAAARRANAYRDGKARSKEDAADEGTGVEKPSTGKKLSYGQTKEIMEKRKRPFEEPSSFEVDEVLRTKAEREKAAKEMQEEKEYQKRVEKEKVPIHGDLRVNKKADGSLRLCSININGLRFWLHRNFKAERLRFMLKVHRVDGLGLQEACINWSAFNKTSKTLASLLRQGTENIRSVHSHNTLPGETENIGYNQRGGTATLLKGELASYVIDSGQDYTKLGRWSWYRVEGEPGCRTRIVTAYAPTGSEASEDASYWKQSQRYIKKEGLKTNPKNMFREDLCKALTNWREAGDRIVLMIDANENVTDHILARMLAKIGLQEAVHMRTNGPGPKTHVRGSESIDGIFVTPEIEVRGASYLPFNKDLGDHRPVMIDVTIASILGRNLPKIVPPRARRLSAKIPRIREEYIKLLEKSFEQHGIFDRLVKLSNETESSVSLQAKSALNELDKLMTRLMLDAEKKCRKVYACHHDFSPEVKGWLDRCHAYRQLISLRKKMEAMGTSKPWKTNFNVGNVKRFARNCGIDEPMSLDLDQLLARYRECKDHTKEVLLKAPWLRKQFMSEKLQEALKNKKNDEARRIKDMIRHEAERKQWQGIHRVTKRDKAGAVNRIEVLQPDGSVKVCTGKKECEEAILKEISVRFERAESAPICQGALFDLLGYGANTETAIEILEGRFDAPEGTDDATLTLFEEIGRIWKLMESGEVDIKVTKEDFQYYWKKVRERTASSYSGLHFGHYIAAAFSDRLSEIHALKLSIITKTGCAPDRWARGLTVMLEKIAGVALVTKLRAILLMEADFNCHNKLIFGSRMMALGREHGLVPDEIFSAKGKTAEDAILLQTLVYDYARQRRLTMVTSSVDAAQCYDRMAHSMLALTLRACKVPQSSVNCMLQSIREMQFYLRTAFGESSISAGGKHQVKQGSCQGNGAAPAGFDRESTVMLGAHRRAGHTVTITTPITRESTTQAGVWFVDDTNLWAGLEESDDVESAVYKAQQGVTHWGRLLIATGGALKPEKCKWTVHDMVPQEDGTWEYRTINSGQPTDENDDVNVDPEDALRTMKLKVPQASGDAVAIEQLMHSEAVENLGLFTRPDGVNEPHLNQVREKIEKWTEQIKSGDLPTRSVWKSYQLQLWASIKYGLGASSASMKELKEGLGSADYYLLSKLGCVRSITKALRYMPSYLGGIGLFDLTTEVTSATLNSLLQHYGTKSPIDIVMKATLQNMQMEMGVTGCPFNYDFKKWGELTTDSWVKAMWEKISTLGLDVDIEYKPIQVPRENDRAIMEVMIDVLDESDFVRFNRARKRQEALFFSDICTANGKRIDRVYLRDWTETPEYSLGQHRSVYDIGLEYPTDEDWKVWESGLRKLCLGSLSLHLPLGKWIGKSTRIWRTFYNAEEGELEVVSEKDGVMIYKWEGQGQYRRAKKADYAAPKGEPATVYGIEEDVYKLLNTGRRLHRPEASIAKPSFLEYLRSWGGAWLWEGLHMNKSHEWVADRLRQNKLVCVTDGSYNKGLAPDICSAGYVLACSETKEYVAGTLVERSPWASSYRGELLGMIALRLLLLAIEEYCELISAGNTNFCDNKGVIHTFEKESKRIPPGKSNGDVLRVLRSVQTRSKSKHEHMHVKAHQLLTESFWKLSYQSQLNEYCDYWAKGAIKEYIFDTSKSIGSIDRDLQMLPLEEASVFIKGVKQTTDMAKGLREHIGRFDSKNYYKEEEIFDEETFESIDFKAVQMALSSKPKMYNLWYGKQCSGFCATGYWMKIRSQGKEDCRCPNCNRLQEDAAHLMVCPCPKRTKLLEESVDHLMDWMKSHHTEPMLAKVVCYYLRGRGRRKFRAPMLPHQLRNLAAAQDRIGYRHFTEGKVTKEFRAHQRKFLASARCRLTADSWMKGFVSQLLHITHSQWIFRCITKHHHTNGTNALKSREEVLTRIEQQLDKGLEALPPEDQWLLEIDPQELRGKSLPQQQYWLLAVDAAREAGEWAQNLSKGATTSWKSILKDGRFANIAKSLPTSTPLPVDEPEEASQERTKEEQQVPSPLPEDGPEEVTQENPDREQQARRRKKKRRKKQKANLPSKPFTPGRKDSPTKSTKGRRKPSDGLDGLNQAALRRQGPPQEVLDIDDLALFTTAASLNRLSRQRVTQELIPKPIQRTTAGTIIESPRLVLRGNESITEREFASLRAATWLNDGPINFFFKICVANEARNIGCYSSGFFEMLYRRGEYDDFSYEEVRNWGANIGYEFSESGQNIGLRSLAQLFVPINISNTHWIFLRVLIQQRRIELYDSYARRIPANRQYMEDMRRYLHTELNKHLPEGQRPGYAEWKRAWKCRDRSARAPQQENTYDCGVFTIVSAYLISRGMELTSVTYNQRTIYSRKVRIGLAHILLSLSQSSEERTTFMAQLDATRRRRRAAVRAGATNSNKRRRRNDSRIVPSGQGQIAALGAARAEASPSTNPSNKRSAASLAEQTGDGAPVSQFFLPRAKKRKKEERG